MSKGAKLRITESFFQLLSTTEFHKITVTQLVVKASINRRTFYDHFGNKDEVLCFIENNLIDEFEAIFTIHNMPSSTKIALPLDFEISIEINLEICRHFKKYQHFYKTRFQDLHFYLKFASVIQKILNRYLQNENVSNYLSFGTVGVLSNWMKHECVEPIEKIAVDLANSGLAPFLISPLTTMNRPLQT